MNQEFEEKYSRTSLAKFREYVTNNKDEVLAFFKENDAILRWNIFKAVILKLIKWTPIGFLLSTLMHIVVGLASLALNKIFSTDIIFVYSLAAVISFVISFVFKNGELYEKLENRFLEEMYGDLLKGLDKEYENSKDLNYLPVVEEKVSLDKFFEYIKRDAVYMKQHPEFDFTEEVKELQRLSVEYASAKKLELTEAVLVNRFSFLSELTKIEIAIYSKTIKNGLRSSIDSHFSEELLEERLEYLGLPSGLAFEDKSLQEVFDDIKRVLRTPYEGCEKELLELFRIAQDYVEETKSAHEIKEYGITTPAAKLLSRIVPIEMEIKRKINESIESEQLDSELSTIQDYLSSIGIETGETGIQSSNVPSLNGRQFKKSQQ